MRDHMELFRRGPDEAALLLAGFCAGILLCAVLSILLHLLRHRSGQIIRIRTGVVHEIGARESQQDAWGMAGGGEAGEEMLAVVADGMGGLADSGQVSKEILSAMQEAYDPKEDTPPDRKLKQLLMLAGERVDRMLAGSGRKSGSTLAACIIRGHSLFWLSVGDSRIYLSRGGGVIALSQDHDFRQDLDLLAMQGEISFEEAETDPRKESLTSYIGNGFPRKVGYNKEPLILHRGDKVLIVSDGIYRALTQEELAVCLRGNAGAAASRIRREIGRKALKGQDNYTALILEIR